MEEQEHDFIAFDFADEYFEEERTKEYEIFNEELLLDIPIPPWVPDDRQYSKDLLEMLHEEIDDFISFISPTEAEHSLRQLTIDRVEAVVHSLWPMATVQVFGSFETKLYLPSSDVDLVVLEPNAAPHCLHQLSKALEKAQICSSIEVIDKAKVPILKIVDGLTLLNADISFNITGGIHSADIVKQFLADPLYGSGMKPLMLILKQFLVQRHLNEVFLGGLGSYSLLIMIASFLRLHPLIQMNRLDPRDNLGVLLLEFLELYGRHFNYDEVGISVNLTNSRYYRKMQVQFPGVRRPGILSLMDPQDESNDVGRGSHNFYAVRNEFFKAYNLLSAMLGSAYEKFQQRRRQPRMTSILGFIIQIKKQVLQARDDMEYIWRDIKEGKIPNCIPRLKNEIIDERQHIVFVADSDESEDSNSSHELMARKRRRLSRIRMNSSRIVGSILKNNLERAYETNPHIHILKSIVYPTIALILLLIIATTLFEYYKSKNFERYCPLYANYSDQVISQLKAPFGWIHLIFSIDKLETLNRVGLDFAIHLAFLKTAFLVLLMSAFIMSLAIYINYHQSLETDYGALGTLDRIISRFSISSIPDESNILWIHVCSGYFVFMVTALMFIYLQIEVDWMFSIALKDFLSNHEKLQKFCTLLVQDIPTHFKERIEVEKWLMKQSIQPMKLNIFSQWDAELVNLFQIRFTLQQKLEKLYMQWHIQIDSFERREQGHALVFYTPKMKFALHAQEFVAKYSAQQYLLLLPTRHGKEILSTELVQWEKMNASIEQLKSIATCENSMEIKALFIRQRNPLEAYKTKLILKNLGMRCILVYSNETLIWTSIGVSAHRRYLQWTFLLVMYFIFCIIWLIPMTLIIFIANIDILATIVGGQEMIKGLKRIYWIYFFIKNILPAVIYHQLMPIKDRIISKLASMEYIETSEKLDELIFHRYFFSLIFHMKLLIPFTSTTLHILGLNQSMDFIAILQNFAYFLPLASSFFARMLAIRLFALPLRLFPHWRFDVSYYFKSTPREFSDMKCKKVSTNNARMLPNHIILFIILLSYSITAPTLLFPGILVFGLSWMILKYRVLFVTKRNRECYGRYWQIISNRCMYGLYISEFILAGTLAVKKGKSFEFLF